MAGEDLRAYVEYFRDMGVHDFYRRGEPSTGGSAVLDELVAAAEEVVVVEQRVVEAAPVVAAAVPKEPVREPARPVVVVPEIRPEFVPDFAGSSIPKPVSFDKLAPLPESRLAAEARPAALKAIQDEIGDCTRCPLAYAGRHMIVFGEGDPSARLMFVGEGPGADEDASGRPFVGKAGQLLNNMIGAMGLQREQVYIANIVKCRPPNNRAPEPAEANTCTQFLVKQMDVVQPEVVVALGATAATYLLGVKQSLSGLRGRWHSCRGAKLAVTYHPAFLLRDPRQKAEAWKDLQMVMKELGLKAPAKE
jgi:uracil-DNA glycosylase